ncbi:hypothetical protein [Cellulomonas sp. P24]|uniref:hypothetical protein n=1 Tax=Cellulomonas sp. P24 TaxID=2885206 RepID=UPI00216AF28D|nr:hypothetical protein [Cellulomonas sp. P24]MCR6494060.1 hypothetical protein [Cellulomonas sp. P24]
MNEPGLTMSAVDAAIEQRTDDIQRLRRELLTAESDLRALNTTREMFARLLAEVGDGAQEAESAPTPSPSDPVQTVLSEQTTSVPEIPPLHEKQRIRSTQLAAEVVRTMARGVSRDDVLAEFGTRGLIPSSWTNPRNAVNNALSRAAQRGLIRFDSDAGLYWGVE